MVVAERSNLSPTQWTNVIIQAVPQIKEVPPVCLTMNEGTLLFVVLDLFDSQALKYSRSEIARHFVI
jgi:hypothetical protein